MVEKSGFTPGPWHLGPAHGEQTGRLYHVWREPGPPKSGWVATVFDGGPISALEADARLIAAAPDLLEALRVATERCEQFLGTFGDLGDCVTAADIGDWRAALSKALGEPHA